MMYNGYQFNVVFWTLYIQSFCDGFQPSNISIVFVIWVSMQIFKFILTLARPEFYTTHKIYASSMHKCGEWTQRKNILHPEGHTYNGIHFTYSTARVIMGYCYFIHQT